LLVAWLREVAPTESADSLPSFFNGITIPPVRRDSAGKVKDHLKRFLCLLYVVRSFLSVFLFSKSTHRVDNGEFSAHGIPKCFLSISSYFCCLGYLLCFFSARHAGSLVRPSLCTRYPYHRIRSGISGAASDNLIADPRLVPGAGLGLKRKPYFAYR
jgi:hypothetical protein